MAEAATNNTIDTSVSESVVAESIVSATVGEPKLWAGKYKSPEEMEEALIGKDKEYGKLYSEHNDIKSKYEQVVSIPENYTAPNDIVLRETELAEIRAIAKNAGLTQAQFEKTAREMQSRIQAGHQILENNKKEIGDEKLAIINDYVKKYYPEHLQNAVLNQIIKDKNAMSDALKDRDARLNSQAPGMDQAGAGTPQKFDGEKDLQAAAETYRKTPNARNKAKYIDMARQVGEERYKDKM